MSSNNEEQSDEENELANMCICCTKLPIIPQYVTCCEGKGIVCYRCAVKACRDPDNAPKCMVCKKRINPQELCYTPSFHEEINNTMKRCSHCDIVIRSGDRWQHYQECDGCDNITKQQLRLAATRSERIVQNLVESYERRERNKNGQTRRRISTTQPTTNGENLQVQNAQAEHKDHVHIKLNDVDESRLFQDIIQKDAYEQPLSGRTFRHLYKKNHILDSKRKYIDVVNTDVLFEHAIKRNKIDPAEKNINLLDDDKPSAAV